MKRFFSRLFLYLLGLVIPVFIAACYGMPYRYGRTGTAEAPRRRAQAGSPARTGSAENWCREDRAACERLLRESKEREQRR